MREGLWGREIEEPVGGKTTIEKEVDNKAGTLFVHVDGFNLNVSQ